MKHMLCILLVLMLFVGCNQNAPETTAPVTTTTHTTAPDTTAPETIPTEPERTWIEEVGKPWDADGSLVELPITVHNGLIYTTCLVFDGDLLLWSRDDHRVDQPQTELCVVDLDSGEVLAQSEISISCNTPPQVLGDQLYLFDSNSGVVVQLDKKLQVIHQWQTQIREANIYMGADCTAYVMNWGGGCYSINLETGEKFPILEEDTAIYNCFAKDRYLQVSYYHPDTGDICLSFVDMYTGQRLDRPLELRDANEGEYLDGTWLFYQYRDGFIYTMITDDGNVQQVYTGYNGLRLLDDNMLLMTNETNNRLSLHDITGKSVAECIISENNYGYMSYEVFPSETFGGYFVVMNNENRGIRVLHWDPTRNQPGEDIHFSPIPEPEETEAQVQSKAEDIEREYGVSILVGEEIDTYFYDFHVETVTDWMVVLDALNTLEDALQDYPEGFFRQLRYGDVHRTEIHLAGALTPINEEYSASYVAFVQEEYDCHVMVVDIFMAEEGTYYHEFSHIIDSFLEWDAMQRPDALFSDETWCSLNPGWFPGYSYNYSWEEYVQDYSCFIDSYSTISPTEDRARVLEYAMLSYGDSFFEVGTVLTEKLDYYCRCIRDAFDTTLWPDTVLWEQYLP